MTTKMKGILKGLRYISQIFDEAKEQEMQIGLPTDVKHVAHIGCDGPSTSDPPSWMKEYKSESGCQTVPLGSSKELREDAEIKWISEDSGRGKKERNSEFGDFPDLSKSYRHQSSTDNTNYSPRKKDSSTKPKQSRRHYQSKGSPDDDNNSNNTKSNRRPKESTYPSPQNLRDISRRSRKKKSKEPDADASGSSRSRSKAAPACNGTVCSAAYLEPGHDARSAFRNSGSTLSPVPYLNEEGGGSRLNY